MTEISSQLLLIGRLLRGLQDRFELQQSRKEGIFSTNPKNRDNYYYAELKLNGLNPRDQSGVENKDTYFFLVATLVQLRGRITAIALNTLVASGFTLNFYKITQNDENKKILHPRSPAPNLPRRRSAAHF